MKPICILMVLAMSGLAFAGDVIHRSKVRNYCHLPCYPYQRTQSSNSVEQSSLNAIPIELVYVKDATANPTTGNIRYKLFQMPERTLRNDHCALERIAVKIGSDGSYEMNFLATQSTFLIPEESERPRYVRFQQNRFYVCFSGASYFPVLQQPAEMDLGTPQEFRIDLAPFWVQQGQSVNKRFSCHELPDVKKHFSTIERLIVELRYE